MNNTGVTILSVLMPTIPEREKIFVSLLLKLQAQWRDLENNHPMLGNVEVIINDTKTFLNGGLSIGKKRQSLSRRANGIFQCQLDDDEDIAPNYLETLMRLCQHDVDVVTFRNLTKTDTYWTVIDMSLKNHNEEATPERIVKRLPWHICPVKTEYAKLYDFEDSNYSEDWTWMEKVLTHCRSEAHTDQILHCYNHSSKHSEADKITAAQKMEDDYLSDHTIKISKEEHEYFIKHGKFPQ